MMPRVSVCMTVYNGESTLGESLESVLRQTYKDYEIVVLDDGSTDSSAGIARSYGCKVISVPNAGTGAARRRLVEEAKGEFIAFIDADDFWSAEKLATQVPVLDETGAAMVHSNCWFLHEDGTQQPREIEIDAAACSFDHVIPGNLVINSSAVFRRQEMLAAGNYIDDAVRCSDWYGWLILAKGRKFVYLEEKLLRYSVLSTSLANGGLKFYEAQYRLLTRHILPMKESLFAGLTPAEQSNYVRLLERSAGVALSGVARRTWAGGDHRAARALAISAIRFAPGSTKVWSRAISCMVP